MSIIQEEKVSINDIVKKLNEKNNRREAFCAYIYDLEQLRKHAASIKRSLPPFCRLFYAMKANPDKRIIKVLDEIVDGFEAASAGEVRIAKAISKKPIIFGAPAKKDYELELIVKGETELANIESFHDANRLQYLAESVQKKVAVVVRVNLQDNVSNSYLKMAGVPTQFGVAERDIPQLLKKLSLSPNLEVRGFHFHAMSNNLDAEAHVRFIAVCLEKAVDWQKKYGISAPVVNVGGGIGINYINSKAPFDWNVLSEGLHNLYKQYKSKKLELIIEMGRYMVAESGFYATEVIDVKVNHGEGFALVRGGSHHLRLPAAWKMNQPFIVLSNEKWDFPFERPIIKNSKVSIAGELCTPTDILAKDVLIKEIRAGDILIFQFAGAYGWTISHHNFLSHPYPEVYYYE
ncbi:pyridoxal-dependent decarboxylase [Planococcus antarcticus DSM 14505]|uniref:Diaminopimelate decarboxylase n=1 Tax=Planococcus antarcticus DSM 14505 TaxID=1185653 RepID=A0A1C7DDD0_9BACL|nr:type III PLP-dependent enzyme [Planococcus antarcticus]ANU09529.1 diaminopimelate decarboxylase [Planococcus antarcticus DSM 14505]EIM06310.1 pyridoxal-dependent decarboxylase [Planococcus antarcticus DSM 14505]